MAFQTQLASAKALTDGKELSAFFNTKENTAGVMQYSLALQGASQAQQNLIMSMMGLSEEQQTLVAGNISLLASEKRVTLAQIAAAMTTDKEEQAMLASELAKSLGINETVKLTAADFALAVAEGTISGEAVDAASRLFAQAAATNGLTKASLSATGALKAMWASNPLGVAAMVITTLVTLMGWLRNSTDTFQSAADKAEELRTAYEDTESELESLSDEVEETTERIAELQKIAGAGGLSLVEQEELESLETYNKYLEEQIRLYEEKESYDAANANDALVEAFESDRLLYNSGSAAYVDLLDSILEQYSDYRDILNEMIAGTYFETEEKITSLGDMYYELLDAADTYNQLFSKVGYGQTSGHPEYIQALIDEYNTFSNLSSLSSAQYERLSEIRELLVEEASVLNSDYISSYVGDGEELEYWQALYDSIDACINPAEHYAEALESLPSDLIQILNGEGATGSLTAERISELAEHYSALSDFMEESGYTAEALANHYNSLATSLDGVSATTDAYEANLSDLTDLLDSIGDIEDLIESANEEMKTGGVSADTISSLAEITDDYIDYLYTENGLIKLNTDALHELASEKITPEYEELEREIQSRKELNAALEETIARYKEQRALCAIGEDWNALISDATEQIAENTAALEEAEEELEKYQLILGDADDELTANQRNLNKARSSYHSLISQLKEATANTESFDSATKANVESIQEQVQATRNQIAQYALLQATLTGAADAFDAFESAQDIDEESDYADDLASMLESLIEMYANHEFGTDAFKSAFSSLIPEDVYGEFEDAVDQLDAGWAYLQDKAARYFTYDDGSITIDKENIEQFVQDALDNGTFTGTLRHFEISSDIQSLEDLAKAMDITTTAAFALGNAISDYTIENDDFLSQLLISSDSLESRIYACDEAMASLLQSKADMIASGAINTDEWIALDEAIREAENDYSTLAAEAREEIQLAIDGNERLAELQAEADGLYGTLRTMEQSDARYEVIFTNYAQVQEELATLLSEIEGPSEMTITVAMESVQADIDSIKEQLGNLAIYDTEAQVYIAIDTEKQANVNELASQLAQLEAEYSSIELYAGTNYEDILSTLQTVQDFEIDDKTFSVSIDGYAETLSELKSIYAYLSKLQNAEIALSGTSSGSSTGSESSGASGAARAAGSANASGNWGLRRAEHRALVGELGTEMIVDPSSGKYYTVGENGAELVDIPRGAIVFNHLQTRQLLANGRAHGRGTALAEGNAHLGLLDGQYTWGSYGHASSSGGSGSSADEDDSEVVDWIEIAIDRIERAINNLATIATSAFHTLTEKLTATNDEIDGMKAELLLQQSAYNRYIQEANSVGLSSELAERVRSGAIDINEYDSETADLISQYQEWYEKALDCSDAILELSESIAESYQNKFDDIASDYENQLSLLEHLTNTYNNSIDDIEERGYLVSTEYYSALQEVERQNITAQKQELADLTAAMSDAINSGYIEEYSDSWYEMQQEINDVTEAIQESETALVEYANAIRDLKWERFDYLQEQISYITEEADFLIDLMENSDLYTDNGQLTDTGTATMGLHAQNYNVYMAQADKYAQELLDLNEQIANDPNNTTLLDRREELLEAQRESILAAEDEKQAIVDMVEEGIELELSALQSLIDSYEDSLDAAKDLYDYEKNIKEQTSEIASLQKQLSAYAGDDSEETRATVQKLQVSLSEAMEDLEETQYENYISEQKKLLDNLYDEYEAILNQRLDDIDLLISDMIDMVNASASSISDTITAESENVGYTLSESMKEIWTAGGDAYAVAAKYGDAFTEQLTSINAVLDAISVNVAAMVTASDEQAAATISSASSTTPTAASSSASGSSSMSTDSASSSSSTASNSSTSGASGGTSSRAYTEEVKQGVATAIWINGSSQSGWGTGTTRKKRLTEKFGSTNANAIQSYLDAHGKNGDLYKQWLSSGKGNLSEYYYSAFKKGGLADYTGIAWLDGTPAEPEMVLNSKDTANFISLKDAMQSVANGDSPLSALFGGDGASTQVLERLSRMDSPPLSGATTIGDITYQVNIPIEHVQDYEDFVSQMSKDGRFEQLIQSMTIDRLVGGSKLAKYKYKQ